MDAVLNISWPGGESKEEYWNRLNKAVADIENKKGHIFTMEDLESYIHEENTAQ